MKILLLTFVVLIILSLSFKFKKKHKRNPKLISFKNKLTNQISSVEKIYSRDEERSASDPKVNIKIGIYDNEVQIAKKANIHRARLAKFKKSKLNGEMIFIENDNRIYKLINGKKKFIS